MLSIFKNVFSYGSTKITSGVNNERKTDIFRNLFANVDDHSSWYS